MLTNLRGRVEADPMAIPAPRRTDKGDPFASVLDRAVQDAPREPLAPAAKPAAAEAAPVQDEPVVDEAAELPPEDRAAPDAAATDDAGATHAGAATRTAAPESTETLSRGESARHETAGKGADSPRTSRSQAPAAEPLGAVVVPQGAQHNGPVVAGAGSAGVTAVGAASAAKGGQALTRGFDAGEVRPNAPTRAAAAAPGYRTQTVAGAELIEQARDSVFKQILLQLDRDGGEMRVRLQPPDLGELDLRLVVEHGNKLTLTITAERGDLAAMLQKHLGELEQTLRASGLEVSDAQVHTRGDGARDDAQGFGSRDRRHADARAADDDTDLPRPRTWQRGEGLDFWA